MKYSCSVGGSREKKSVWFLYRHVRQFRNNALTMYIFPTDDKPTFKFFLKSRNLKSVIMSPNSHSTDVRTALIAVLNSCICGVSTAFRKGH